MPIHYAVELAETSADLQTDFDGAFWRNAPPLTIAHFHPRSSPHRPLVRAKLLHDGRSLYVLFHARDRYVRCTHTEYQDMVCKDSCVEFFAQPKADRGYFNFEVNCGGTMLIWYIEDPTRVEGAMRKFTKVSPEHANMIQIATTLPRRVEPEIAEPVEWRLAMRIPFAMMEQYVGAIGDVRGQIWRGNFYKCGDHTSHPHWASWSPIGEKLDFHQPQFFGELKFEHC